MTNSDPLKTLWNSNNEPMDPLTPRDLHKLAKKFQGKIARRNVIEYIAAAVVIAFFGAFCFFIPLPLARLGSAMLIVGMIYVVWSLHTRAGSSTMSGAETAQSMMSFHRGQMEKQRDALNSIWSWYILPIIPGALVFLIGTTPEFATEPTLLPGVLDMLPRVSFAALVCLAVWWINKRAARKLDAEIKSLQLLNE